MAKDNKLGSESQKLIKPIGPMYYLVLAVYLLQIERKKPLKNDSDQPFRLKYKDISNLYSILYGSSLDKPYILSQYYATINRNDNRYTLEYWNIAKEYAQKFLNKDGSLVKSSKFRDILNGYINDLNSNSVVVVTPFRDIYIDKDESASTEQSNNEQVDDELSLIAEMLRNVRWSLESEYSRVFRTDVVDSRLLEQYALGKIPKNSAISIRDVIEQTNTTSDGGNNEELILVYYTKYELGLKIIESCVLQPGALIGQNDPNEIFYGLGNNDLEKELRMSDDFISYLGQRFIISTVHEINKDNLTMWRGYGNDGDGMGIVLRVNVRQLREMGGKVMKMEYSPKVNTVLPIDLEDLNGEVNGLNEKFRQCVEALVSSKHSFYESEQEFRLFFNSISRDFVYSQPNTPPNRDRIHTCIRFGFTIDSDSHQIDNSNGPTTTKANVNNDQIVAPISFKDSICQEPFDKVGKSHNVYNDLKAIDFSKAIKLAQVVLGPRKEDVHIISVQNAIRSALGKFLPDDVEKFGKIKVVRSRGSYR